MFGHKKKTKTENMEMNSEKMSEMGAKIGTEQTSEKESMLEDGSKGKAKAIKLSLKKAKKDGKKHRKGSFKLAMRDLLRKKQFKLGTYTAAMTAIVLVILVIINMCVSALPAKYTSFDMTADSLYSISEQTEKIVKGLEEPVRVYWIVQEGNEDETVKLLLENYEDLSRNFEYEKIDPVVNPNFASAYTSESLYNNSLIVVNDDESKTRYISYYDIFDTSYDENYNEVVEYNGEGALTSAVNYVSSDTQTQLYALTGHGEDEIPSSLESSIQGENMIISELNLLSENEIPTDCEALVIFSPSRDISADEIEKIESYLENGGKLLLFTDCDSQELSNLYELTEKYGMEPVEGMVVESDTNLFLGNYPNYLMPQVESHEISDPIADGNYYILMPIAQGIRINTDEEFSGEAQVSGADDEGDEESSLQVSALLRSSSGAYSKISGIKAKNAEKEDGDIDAGVDGFALAAAAEDLSSGAKVVWMGSTTLADESVDSAVAGANTDLILNSIGWMCEIEDSVSIHAKTVSSEYLSLTSAQTSRWTTIMVGVVPIAFIAAGIYVFVRRRKLHG